MDIHKALIHTSKVHRMILTIITIVFSSLSCISIVFTLIAFRFAKIIKKNREKTRTKDLTAVTTHLCVCLLASLLIFLIGIIIHHLNLRVFFFIIFYFYLMLTIIFKRHFAQ
jgi:hypothetical protein